MFALLGAVAGDETLKVPPSARVVIVVAVFNIHYASGDTSYLPHSAVFTLVVIGDPDGFANSKVVAAVGVEIVAGLTRSTLLLLVRRANARQDFTLSSIGGAER